MPSLVEYLGLWSFERMGTIPVYAEEYMPPDKLYIIGLPEEEPSPFLVDSGGKPLLVPNFRRLRKIGLINPHPAETVMVIDYTEREET